MQKVNAPGKYLLLILTDPDAYSICIAANHILLFNLIHTNFLLQALCSETNLSFASLGVSVFRFQNALKTKIEALWSTSL
jgi:hypothetical protein